MDIFDNNDFSLENLSDPEALNINGGSAESLWYWVAYGVGATVRGLYEFGQAGGEYQSSLSSSLKK